jgi:hypothetical protein
MEYNALSFVPQCCSFRSRDAAAAAAAQWSIAFGQKAASRVKRMTKHFRRTFGWLMMPLLLMRFRALAAGKL